jgi:hypothetical protein
VYLVKIESKVLFDLLNSFLAAIALSKTLDYYADTESSEMTSSPSDSVNDDEDGAGSDNENDKNNRTLYDKAGKITRRPNGLTSNNPDGDDDGNIVSSNIKTIVVICSTFIDFHLYSNKFKI